MKVLNILLALLIALCSPVIAAAFEVGIGASISKKYLTVSTVDNKQIAALEGDSGVWPHLSIKTEDKYFGDSSFGYFYYGWYSQSEVDKVKDSPTRSLPSPVHLAFFYAGATAFYVFGDKKVLKDNGHSQHAVGIGAGWGASSIKGVIPAAFTSTGVDETLDSNLTGSSANIFYRYMWDEWYFMFDVSTVQVNNGKKLETSDQTITLGRYFEY